MADRSGVCAALLVKDEADIIEFTVRHLLDQVDHVIVADNLSTDGTYELLKRIGSEPRAGRASLDIWIDEEVGYYQSRKMTDLGRRAYELGYDWYLPCDADEYWYSPFGRISDVLAGVSEREPQLLFLRARVLNHLVTPLDPADEPNPFRRLGYRLVEENPLPKVACRTSPALTVGMGNHEAWNHGIVSSARATVADGELVVRHFPWRSEEQFLRKITNGSRAYAAAPEVDETFGAHWRQFGLPGDPWFEEHVRQWFRDYGYRANPLDLTYEPLIYDPALVGPPVSA